MYHHRCVPCCPRMQQASPRRKIRPPAPSGMRQIASRFLGALKPRASTFWVGNSFSCAKSRTQAVCHRGAVSNWRDRCRTRDLHSPATARTLLKSRWLQAGDVSQAVRSPVSFVIDSNGWERFLFQPGTHKFPFWNYRQADANLARAVDILLHSRVHVELSGCRAVMQNARISEPNQCDRRLAR